MVRIAVIGEAHVHYSQIYVVGEGMYPDLFASMRGQRNGLCGAAEPGTLFLITGLHTGSVGFTVEVHDEPPLLDDAWEDVVEASFRPLCDTFLMAWAGEQLWPLELDPVDYRVRYCGTGLDAARQRDTRLDDEPQLDRYLLQLWPAAPGPDRVVRQTSKIAAYWHGLAAEQPPALTPGERAEAARREEREAEQRREEALLRAEEQQWNGVFPSERLRRLPGHARNVAQFDRPLVDALAATDEGTQRAVARWTARHAFDEAGMSEVRWIADGLAAMDTGRPMPPPLDDRRQSWNALLNDDLVPHTLVASPDRSHNNYLRQAMVFPALTSAQEEDALQAAVDVLWHAAVSFGPDARNILFQRVRQAFPQLAVPQR